MTRTVIGVLGGSGGVGASSFAAVLAAGLAAEVGRAALVDVDPAGGGVDVLLGVEAVTGLRWSGLRVGGGRLDPDLLLNRLPVWHSVAVLACDRGVPTPSAARQVAEALALRCPVVLDLPRAPGGLRDELVAVCDAVILVVAAAVRQLTAAAAVLRSLPLERPPVGVVARGGSVEVADAELLVGAPVLAELDADEGDRPISDGMPRSAVTVAAGIVDGLMADARC